MGTSQEVIAASVSLVVSITIAIIMVISLGPPWDFFIGWLGEQEISTGWMSTIQPLFGMFYGLVLLWVVTSFIWLIKTVVKRSDYTAGYDARY